MQAGSELSVGLGTPLGSRRRPNREHGPEPSGKERRIFEFENNWDSADRPETRLCRARLTDGANRPRLHRGAEQSRGRRMKRKSGR